MNILLKPVAYIVNYYYKQRSKMLESSREKWKQKAIDRLKQIHVLERRLEETETELKKIDSQS